MDSAAPFTTRVSRACNVSSYLLFMCVSQGSLWDTRDRMNICSKEHLLDGLTEYGLYRNGCCTLQRLRECLTSPNLALKAARGLCPPWKAEGTGSDVSEGRWW